jgi:ACT domain-containing protein
LADYETYIVEIGHKQGRRYSKRHPLHIPLDVATENYEALSDLEIRNVINDLTAEQLRRTAKAVREADVAAACNGYDPAASQHRGGHE